jgi:hypothetical protein
MATATEQRRKARFLKALASAKQTQSGWAQEHGVSKAHLSLVLAGKRESGVLTEKIDAFIRAHLEKHTAQVA